MSKRKTVDGEQLASKPQGSAPLDTREIFVAIVAPLGSPVDATIEAFHDEFSSHDYTVEDVRISALLDEAIAGDADDDDKTNVARLMDKGDRLRKALDYDAACAHLAVLAISSRRAKKTGSRTTHRTRHVNLIRSLKTPGEVSLLRKVYGQRLIVVGVSSTEEQRRKELVNTLKKERKTTEPEAEAERLRRRDNDDVNDPFGQRSSKAYQMADAFVAATAAADAKAVGRLVELLLGRPFQTPSRDEQAMYYAWAAKCRSSAAGRQVGAAIIDRHGEVVALGCNDVPSPLGGQYWPNDPEDRRDWKLGFDANDAGKFDVTQNVLDRLSESGWLNQDKSEMGSEERALEALKASGPVGGSQLADLIEYGRIVHAEMAAITTAAREGRAVDGCTLYTTTYPCHECARLIIAAGIVRVCFVDPYAKSRAPDLFERMLDGSGTEGRVQIEPFAGVSPRLFPRVFGMTNRSKDVRGVYEKWEKRRKKLVALDQEYTDSIPRNESGASTVFTEMLVTAKEAGLNLAKPAEMSEA